MQNLSTARGSGYKLIFREFQLFIVGGFFGSWVFFFIQLDTVLSNLFWLCSERCSDCRITKDAFLPQLSHVSVNYHQEEGTDLQVSQLCIYHMYPLHSRGLISQKLWKAKEVVGKMFPKFPFAFCPDGVQCYLNVTKNNMWNMINEVPISMSLHTQKQMLSMHFLNAISKNCITLPQNLQLSKCRKSR